MPTAVEAKPASVPHGASEGGAARIASIVDLLLSVGYIDGVFHQREQEFVRRYLESVIILAEQSVIGVSRGEIATAWHRHFSDVYQRLEREISALAAEVQASGDPSYLPTRLKVRAMTVFRGLEPSDQALALEMVQALVHADGVVTPPEQQLYAELVSYFHAPVPAPGPPPGPAPAAAPSDPRAFLIAQPEPYPLKSGSHPLLDVLEQTYSPHPLELGAQLARDHQLILHAIGVWDRQRAAGHGRLDGVTDVMQLPAGTRMLDRHIHVLRPARPLELIVLGDLHGCYGCLKAALLQSDFIRRVWAHQWDPFTYPDVKLVFLGDYIDRGRFSFDGVLRAVLQLLVSIPEHVMVLRGNHEWFVKIDEGQIRSGVHPAEALASLRRYAPFELLDAYRVLFEHMPTSLFVDRTLLVHGGIARDDTFAERYRDLGSLDDPDLRFQMMWSDPAATDHVPVELQRKNPRFSFGRKQFAAFMDKIGATTLIRGHEQIDRGFEIIYNLGDKRLLSLFSAGGATNRDLPEGAPYRKVTPMALTLLHGQGPVQAIPWPIEYEPFNYETYNGLHRQLPLLEFRYT